MKKITLSQIKELATNYGIPLAHIRASIEVEASGSGFLPDGRPKILFERHKFYKYAQGKFAATHPEICNKTMGGYATGATSLERMQKEWERLALAMELNREAAILSASWGMGQVMGFHWQSLGYPTPQMFVNAMFHSEYQQLIAMFNFIKQTPALLKAIQAGNWPTVAFLYNGKSYAKNQYDKKLAAAAEKFKKEIA